jgi:hypothetical protein
MAQHPLFRAWVALQSHQRREMDARALKWLDGEFDHPERFRVERWDAKQWVVMEQD